MRLTAKKQTKRLEHGASQIVLVGPNNRGQVSRQVSRLLLRTQESSWPRGRSRGQGRGQTELNQLEISRGSTVIIPVPTPLKEGLSSSDVTLTGFVIHHGSTGHHSLVTRRSRTRIAV